MNDFASLLEFPLGTRNEFGVGPHSVIVAGPCIGAAKLGDAAGGLVYGDDIAGEDALGGHRVDHFGTHVIDCFHVGCFNSQFALFITLRGMSLAQCRGYM